jgi:peptidoglycan hydrolase CwlO-like protein
VVDRTVEVLARLRSIVEGAKAVPMSASCMVNRADALGLVDRAMAAVTEDMGEAQRVTRTSLETLERAQAEAAQIIAAAEEKASFLASNTPVMEEALRKAALLERKSIEDAEALKREADAYVDARIASFEAALQKTMAQVATMRARLSSRSGLDGGETQALPRLQG